jgi:hypothetical protein
MAEKGGTKILAIVTIFIVLISILLAGCIKNENEKDNDKDNEKVMEKEIDDDIDINEEEDVFHFIHSNINANGIVINGSISEKEETIYLLHDFVDLQNKLIYLPSRDSIISNNNLTIKCIQTIYNNISCPDYDTRGSLINFGYFLPQNFSTILRGNVWHNITVLQDGYIRADNGKLIEKGQIYNYSKKVKENVSYSHAGGIENATILITYNITVENFGFWPISNIKDYNEIYITPDMWESDPIN